MKVMDGLPRPGGDSAAWFADSVLRPAKPALRHGGRPLLPDDVQTLTNDQMHGRPHPGHGGGFSGARISAFSLSLPSLVRWGRRWEAGRAPGPRARCELPRAGRAAPFPLLPLISGFLIKITWAVSARHAGVFSLFSVDGNHMWNLRLPFPSKRQMEGRTGRPLCPAPSGGLAALGRMCTAPAGTRPALPGGVRAEGARANFNLLMDRRWPGPRSSWAPGGGAFPKAGVALADLSGYL